MNFLAVLIIVIIGILARGGSSNQFNLKSAKDDAAETIDNLEIKISTIKSKITEIESAIETDYSGLNKDAFEALEIEKNSINGKINALFETCQDDQCTSCFKVQESINKTCEENENDAKNIVEKVHTTAVGHLNSIFDTIGDYEKNVTEFRATLEDCADDVCFVALSVLVTIYETDTVDRDDFKNKAEVEESTFVDTGYNNTYEVIKMFYLTSNEILTTIKECVENAATTTVTETTNTAPTTQKIETTTNNQAKVVLNLFILISMFIITKIFA